MKAWEPPELVAFTRHLDRDPAAAQRIEVRFSAADEGTVVELTHRDWRVFGEQASEQRNYYAGGWDGVLGRYTANSS